MKQTPTAPLIPHTKSKHPLVILKAVIKAICDEPKRYNQETFLMREDQTPDAFDVSFPACGTVACVAGWACIVTSGVPHSSSGILGRAQALLRLTGETSDGLFSGGALGQKSYGDIPPAQYARLGVRHIIRFAKKTWGQQAADYLKGKVTRAPRITRVR